MAKAFAKRVSDAVLLVNRAARSRLHARTLKRLSSYRRGEEPGRQRTAIHGIKRRRFTSLACSGSSPKRKARWRANYRWPFAISRAGSTCFWIFSCSKSQWWLRTLANMKKQSQLPITTTDSSYSKQKCTKKHVKFSKRDSKTLLRYRMVIY